MYVSFSLPAWLRGFDSNSMNLLKTTAAAGVRIDIVNMMAQSFGVANIQSLVPATLARASILAFRASALQIATIYPNKTQTQIKAMMDITTMIGTNDDGSTFMLADFAKVNGVGLL